MYESHFGLTGPPFSLNPDPAFYFQSKGHGNALSYLRFGVHQGEGFVVITGEIGAGKTTLVRALLSELDERKIVAAQIVSTQLEAGDLLRSVALAFGIQLKNLSKAELIASIEAFLTLLITQGKRALLIVDEAQNLELRAIEELRMLSNFQLGQQALLQSFLVGQPELRQLLTSGPMEQFRQRVIASCHLGPMEAQETREYVLHRLRHVGWHGRPQIEESAFELIHRRTAGIPRRVNLLCNRLLLSAYLTGEEVIAESLVQSVVEEALGEIGPAPRATTEALPTSDPAAADRPVLPFSAARNARATESGPVLCVATNRHEDIKLSLLLRAMRGEMADLAPLLVRSGDEAVFGLNDAFLAHAELDVPTVEVQAPAGRADGLAIAGLFEEFQKLIELHRPRAVIAAGWSDPVLACAIVAAKNGHRFAHVDAACDPSVLSADERLNHAMLLGLLHASGAPRGLSAAVDAGGASQVLLEEAVGLAAEGVFAPMAVLAQVDGGRRRLLEQHGYGLVLHEPAALCDGTTLADEVRVVRRLAEDVPMVWPMDRATSVRLDSMGLRKQLKGDRITILPPQGYAETIALAASARCVLTESTDVAIEARALDVPVFGLSKESCDAVSLQRMLKSEPSAGTVRIPRRTRHDAASITVARQFVHWILGSPGEGLPAVGPGA